MAPKLAQLAAGQGRAVSGWFRTLIESLPIHSTRYDSSGLAHRARAAQHGLSAKLSAQISPLFLLMRLAHRFDDSTAAIKAGLHQADFSLSLADRLLTDF